MLKQFLQRQLLNVETALGREKECSIQFNNEIQSTSNAFFTINVMTVMNIYLLTQGIW